MKPTKADFASFLPSLDHLDDDLINPRINDAFKFDIKPKLNTLATDILAYSGTDRPQLRAFYEDYLLHWWVLLAYKTGKICFGGYCLPIKDFSNYMVRISRNLE